MDASWHPNGIKNRSFLVDVEKQKNAYETNMFLMIFEVRGVQVGSKNQSKIDPKMSSTWEVILTSMFDRF